MSLLQKQYIQKSRIFLLPLIGVRKDRVYRPTNTYISSPKLINQTFPSGISIEDRTLITVYTKDYERREEDNVARQKLSSIVGSWSKFETEVLMSNRYFVAFFETKDEYIYAFDLSDWSADFDSFVKGKYSELSPEAKSKILEFRWRSLEPTEQQKLYCYLYPYKDECIRSFAKALTTENPSSRKFENDFQMNIQILTQAGELCTKPDLSLETYIFDSEMEAPQEQLINESQD